MNDPAPAAMNDPAPAAMTNPAPAAVITRPLDGDDDLAEALSRRGFRPIAEPLLRIDYLPGPLLSREGHQALLLTSANGARALAARLGENINSWSDLPVMTVGDATAHAARHVGFRQVASAGGDVDSLAALVQSRLNPTDGTLLQIAATDLAGNLQAQLVAAGFTVDKQILYRAQPVATLSGAVIDEWRRHLVGAALFFSPRTAATFASLATRQGLADDCSTVVAACLSAAVADKLAGLVWRSLRIADRPNQADLLTSLDGE